MVPTREVVEGVTYAEDITLSFKSSSDLTERVFFESWQEQAFNDQTWDVGYYNDYVGVVDIYLLDREDKRRYGIRLWEAFPKTINAIELGNDQTNAIIKTDISMAFQILGYVRYTKTTTKRIRKNNRYSFRYCRKKFKQKHTVKCEAIILDKG